MRKIGRMMFWMEIQLIFFFKPSMQDGIAIVCRGRKGVSGVLDSFWGGLRNLKHELMCIVHFE